MSKNKDVKFSKVVKFRNDQPEYVLQLKKSHNWWWLLLLLLPLLLLIRCNHDLTVTCHEERSGKMLPGLDVEVSYDSRYLYKDGSFFVTEHHDTLGVTNASGDAVFENIETTIYSLIFHFTSKVNVTADRLYSVDKRLHYTRHVTFNFDNVDCDFDIVMCIDNTGSMRGLIEMVKTNALNFCDDLTRYCTEHHRVVKSMRVKVISYGDFEDGPLVISDVFNLPDEKEPFQKFVSDIQLTNGQDAPENSLEAIAAAMQTDWVKTENRLRHVIVVYTDASACALDNPTKHTVHYPADMPKDFDELTQRWKAMDASARKLVLFAPSGGEPWAEIEEKWPDVYLEKGSLKSVLSGTGYEKALEAINKSL